MRSKISSAAAHPRACAASSRSARRDAVCLGLTTYRLATNCCGERLNLAYRLGTVRNAECCARRAEKNLKTRLLIEQDIGICHFRFAKIRASVLPAISNILITSSWMAKY